MNADPQSAARGDFLAGGGEMGELIRGHDWARSPLGAPETWPQSLRTAVGIMLNSRYPMFVWWGEGLINLYNDAYRQILGAKHPQALGRSAQSAWAEIWDSIGPRAEAVLKHAQSTFDEALLLMMDRFGYMEETYFTFSYSPVFEDGGRVGGLFCAVTEETQRVTAQRRMQLLREAAAAFAETKTVGQMCRAATDCIERASLDLPFALLYLVEPEGTARLAGTAGTEDGWVGAPAQIDLAAADPVWPLAAARGEDVVLVQDLEGRAPGAPRGGWDRAPSSAAIVPLQARGDADGPGFLVVGLNPYRPFDADYRGFLELLSGQIAAGLANAHAYAEERRRADALAELDKAKTVFFSNVSHEFRTPLTLMLAPLEQMLREPDGSSDRDLRLAGVAHRNAIRLLKLVNALLDFSRIEAGRVQARFEPTDLARFTAELASNFRSAVEAAGLRLTVDCRPLPEPVFVDRDMWEKIVLNLLSNAFKFTFEGEIAVRLSQAAGTVRLEVEDTGAGIAEADLTRIFQRFHRIESAQGRSFEGTGIGLALVQELVRLHGGEVAVESAAGRGSTFSVSIPLGRAHLPPEQVRLETTHPTIGSRAQVFVSEALGWLGASEPPGVGEEGDGRSRDGGGRRILLADDNADMRDYVARLLTSSGYEVEATRDGQAALDAARARPADLVLTDVMMPGLDGLGLLKALRGDPRTAQTPVILLSARAGEEAKLEGLQTGADDYLVKPFSSRELLARVTAAIRLAAARQEAARAAEQENLRIRGLFEQAPGFIAILSGPEHVFEFANAAYIRLVGGRAVLGKPVRQALPEVKGQGYLELLDRVYSSGERHVGREAQVRLQDRLDAPARDVLLDFIYEPIRTPEGAVSGIFVEGYEVTDRVAAQAALKAREEQLRLATEAGEVGLWDVDVVNDVLYWPPRVKAMFGISPDVPVTMADFYAGLHPEDRAAATAAYNAAADPQSRSFYDVEYRTVGKEDHIVRWVAAKGRGVFDGQGRCVRVLGAAIDITERKAAEARLKELNDLLEQRIAEVLAERKLLADIVEGTDAFVQVADLNYRWLAINRASADEFERIFGLRPRVGAGMLDLLAHRPEHQASVKAVWSRALAGEEFTEIAPFGEAGLDRRYYEMKFNALRDKEGRQIGAYQFAYDVTERLRDQERLAEAEAALRQTQKLEAMGQLTGGVAHDFNNLLTPIVGSLDLLQSRGVGGDREQRLIAGALQAAERAKTLVQRLLAFARRQPLQAGPVDVASLIRNMAELVDSTTGPQINVLVDAADDLPPARADANQLEMAILNLSVNARDAMPQGGTLSISADAQVVEPSHRGDLKPGRYVRISVADTGAGMDEATLARAIEPFFSTKGVGKGTGLGLSMVHGLASQLGGALTIASRLGLGTKVELWLPLSREPLRSADLEPHRPARVGAGAVLLVDDEEIVRMTAAAMLAEIGFSVTEAESADRALQLLSGGLSVDLLITDHLMPGATGVELAYAVRQRWPAVRLLLISGFAEAEGLAPDLMRLTKPFRQAELAAALAELGLAANAQTATAPAPTPRP